MVNFIKHQNKGKRKNPSKKLVVYCRSKQRCWRKVLIVHLIPELLKFTLCFKMAEFIISPITRRNSIGDKIQPCLTAHFTSKDDDKVPPCKTRHLASLYVDLILWRYQMLFQSQQIPDEARNCTQRSMFQTLQIRIQLAHDQWSLLLIICVLVKVAFLTLLERKVLGYIQKIIVIGPQGPVSPI